MSVAHGSHKPVGLLSWRRELHTDVFQQAGCISVSRVSGIPFFAKTISGAAGYSGEGMGSFFRNDNIVLCSSSTCGSVPGQYCGETRGYPGLCIDLDFDVI